MTTIKTEPTNVSAAVAEAAKKIPQKIFFRIGEVARLLEVKTSVLRFWETEFPSIHPTKAPSGHRVYRRKEVEKLFLIKQLLYVERFSIEGARKKLSERGGALLGLLEGSGSGAPTAMTGMVLRSEDWTAGNPAPGAGAGVTAGADATSAASVGLPLVAPLVDVERLRKLLERPIRDLFRY